ncbi:hypothetical protein [Methylobacterium sp. JK268]
MRRPLLTASVLLLSLAAPAAADGMPEDAALPPEGYGPGPAAPRHWRPAARPRFARSFHVQPVGYGVTDGVVYHAWMPRNDRLPVYNVPPPFFPEE